MANRTQKAAPKAKADAAKAPATKTPKVAKPTKAAKPTKDARKTKMKGLESSKDAPPVKSSWSERFWHAVTGKAEKQEHVAHEHAVEREHQRAESAAAEKKRLAAQALADKAEARAAAAAERRKTEHSKREMLRIAKEEEARLKEQLHQAKLAAAREKRAAESLAKKEAAAVAQRAEAEKIEAAKQAEAAAALERAEQAKARALERKAQKEAEQAVEAEAERVKAEKAEAAKAQRKAAKEAEEAEAAEAERAKSAKAATQQAKPVAKPAPEVKVKAAPKPAASSPADHQADRLAAELASRRSQPIVIDAEDDIVLPKIPGVGRSRAPKEEGEVMAPTTLTPAPPAKMVDAAPRGLSLPESFILLALDGEWSERHEKTGSGAFGGGLVGAMVLELALRGRLHVQRDRFVLTGSALTDDSLEAIAALLSGKQDTPSLQAMTALAKETPTLLAPFKARLKQKGYVDHAEWRHLGVFPRSQLVLTDVDAQERLQGKLRRAIAGGGTPDASTILALGLLDASGLFETVVPAGAVDYNRKRLNGLLAGRDVMGYAVDKELKGLQEIAVRTVLGNVRAMSA